MLLSSVYARHDRHTLLYRLLEDRDETVNISHRGMPWYGDHMDFVDSKPYEAWYFIGEKPYGAIYLSKQNEIGIFLFSQHRGKGIAPRAIKALMEMHGKRRYLANINPKNEGSASLFAALGFKLIQHTYESV